MATYFHGAPEIHPDGLQTLYLMNPGYVGYADPAGAPAANMVFLNSGGITSLNPINLSHSPPPNHQQQHFVGIPLPPPQENSAGRFHYNLWNPAPATNLMGRGTTQQGLSLSLSPQQPHPYGSYRAEAEVSAPMPEMTIAGDDGVRPMGTTGPPGPAGIQSVLMNSKYLKAAQELLDEVVSVGKGVGPETMKKNGEKSPMKSSKELDGKGEGESSGKREAELTTAERQELQMKKAKLVGMLGEVEQRYRQYHHQMQIVVSSFEAVAGHGSARTYTALALQTISKQFRCLRDAISGQLKATGRSLGEEDCLVGGAKSIGSRLRLVDHHLRQQRALQQLGMMQHNAWRPQRGLPERAVSILRAWLFEHFLHPYPKDSDKLMLAKQTGLTRSQVSNWFINARVRLWKPMVEEMYVEETKEHEQMKPEEKSNYSESNEDSTSKASSQTKTEQANSFTSKKQDKSNEPKPSSSIAIPVTKFGISNNHDEESLMQPFLKKVRNNESLHLNPLPHSLTLEMKPEEFSNRELLMKFMEARSNANNGHALMNGGGNHGGGFNAYSIGDIGRFDTEQFTPSFHGNGVSLTLGLQHCESLSLTGTEPPYLSNESIPMGNEANAFCSLNNNPQASHPSNAYESIDIQNRKRFAAQLLPDFVA